MHDSADFKRPQHNDAHKGEAATVLDVENHATQSTTTLRSYKVVQPRELTTPLVFASPHSGRSYPDSFLAQAIVDTLDLRRVEDAFVDLLLENTPEIGAPKILALVGRACVDLNRAPEELDASMFAGSIDALTMSRSPRVSAGLGCIPRVAHAGKAIYRKKLTADEALFRLEQIYRPYHRALNDLLHSSRERFGAAILVDCHSMPSRSETGAPLPDFVLGDRFGASCAPQIISRMEKMLVDLGYKVSRNSPYAGGFTTSSLGKPDQGQHAIQIEINRRLYLDEDNVELNHGFERLKTDLGMTFAALAKWSQNRDELINTPSLGTTS